VGADSKWDFLVPVTLAAAALLGIAEVGIAEAEATTKAATLEQPQKDDLTVTAPTVGAQAQHAYHESHSSHRSHRSHSSHYSSR
jgi:hypothetical protein